VTYADDDHVWVVGSDAGVFKSTNGGSTFTTATRTLPGEFIPSQLTMRSVAFANPYDGLIVSTYQMVWRTSDAGASWTPEQLVDPSTLYDTLYDYELRCVAFAGSAAVPVIVGRYYGGFFPASNREKTRAYRGSWVGLVPQPPFAPSGVKAADGGAPRPRITVTWADNSADEDGFVIERSQGSASGPWDTLATLGAGVTSFTDSAVDWTSTWYYRVRSFRGDLNSGWAVSAPFEGDIFTVTSSHGMNGSISPLGVSAPITYGADSAIYTITPAPGSVISNVVVDGVSVGKISAYKFTDVRADHTIRATFMRVTALTITSNRTTSTGGRSIAFSGTISPNMKNGTHVIVEWIKSGAHSWTRLASYVDTFSSHHWSYTLSTRTRAHGTYFVRVRYAGGTTFLPCGSISRKIVIR